MKIISYNIRGLRGRIKKRKVREMVVSQKHDMLSIQESKLEGVDRKLCSVQWGGNEFQWVAKNVAERSGV